MVLASCIAEHQINHMKFIVHCVLITQLAWYFRLSALSTSQLDKLGAQIMAAELNIHMHKVAHDIRPSR